MLFLLEPDGSYEFLKTYHGHRTGSTPYGTGPAFVLTEGGQAYQTLPGPSFLSGEDVIYRMTLAGENSD
ncbi:MAG TPA: hypothetical protein VMS21_14360, partial [Methylomirabilota bacterium]|nr:hypothetical protein [Methylomirabilota bacterium]